MLPVVGSCSFCCFLAEVWRCSNAAHCLQDWPRMSKAITDSMQLTILQAAQAACCHLSQAFPRCLAAEQAICQRGCCIQADNNDASTKADLTAMCVLLSLQAVQRLNAMESMYPVKDSLSLLEVELALTGHVRARLTRMMLRHEVSRAAGTWVALAVLLHAGFPVARMLALLTTCRDMLPCYESESCLISHSCKRSTCRCWLFSIECLGTAKVQRGVSSGAGEYIP